MRSFAFIVIRTFLVVLVLATPARALETRATAALVLDFNTGTILLSKNADTSLPPASMSKLMTLNMVFEALEDGRLHLDEMLPVSEHAMSYGGSTMFLNTRDKVKVEDLIRGIVVLSGNDATVVLAEALAGTEAEFARTMTARAKALGMSQSTFANSNGWPHPNQRMSARDLAFLAHRLIAEFPQYYGYFAETDFAFDGRAPDNHRNRNPLLRLNIGADGLKTGHTRAAGYGVVGSAVRGGRRVIIVLSGLDSAKARAQEAEKLVNWAFRQFVQKKILRSGQELGRAKIWLGRSPSVALLSATDLELLLPVSEARQLQSQLIFSEPVEAPVTKGQVLGKIRIDIPGMKSTEVDLIAGDDVATAGFGAKLRLSAAILRDRIFALVR